MSMLSVDDFDSTISLAARDAYVHLTQNVEDLVRLARLRMQVLSEGEAVEFYLLAHANMEAGRPSSLVDKLLMELGEHEFDRRNDVSGRAAKLESQSEGVTFRDCMEIVESTEKTRLIRELGL